MDRSTPPNNLNDPTEAGSLEGGTSLETSSDTTDTTTPQQPIVAGGSAPKPPKRGLKSLWHKGSIYLLAFALLFIISLIVMAVFYLRNDKESTKPEATIKTQNLSAEALQSLANSSGLQVGDSKQVLNIQSNAVFAGTALVRGDLQVGGNIRTGGSLNLTGLTVTGPGTFERVQAQSLAVAGTGTFTGQLSTQGSFNAAGGGSFGGPVSTPTLNANNLQLAGNLVLNNHIQAGGARPGSSPGNALGGGGTASLSGSDTAGTISINTGSNPSAGCFMNVRFAKGFSGPRVNVTPVGGGAGGLQWYVNRDGGGFSVCTNNGAPASQSFAFDYFIVD